MDWNDVKIALSVLENGSTLAASRLLGLSQSTVMRRITALEDATGVSLFDKQRTGYAPTDHLNALKDKLAIVADAHADLKAEMDLMRRGLAGTVRLTAPDLIVGQFLSTALLSFREQYPMIRVELITTNAFLDLAKGEADIAFRGGDPPTAPDLVGRRIVKDSWSLYAGRAYVERHGKPSHTTELIHHNFIMPTQINDSQAIAKWVEAHIPKDRVVLWLDNYLATLSSLKAGMGISLCSDFIAAGHDDMIRCLPLNIDTGKEVWLLTHERHRHSTQIRTVLDFLGANIATRLKLMKAMI